MKKHSRLEDLLRGVLKGLKKKGALTAEEVAGVWLAAAGEGAAVHTRPVGLRRGCLIVNVDDSGWLYELTTKKREILAKLGPEIGGRKLKDIRFRIGEIRGKG